MHKAEIRINVVHMMISMLKRGKHCGTRSKYWSLSHNVFQSYSVPFQDHQNQNCMCPSPMESSKLNLDYPVEAGFQEDVFVKD